MFVHISYFRFSFCTADRIQKNCFILEMFWSPQHTQPSGLRGGHKIKILTSEPKKCDQGTVRTGPRKPVGYSRWQAGAGQTSPVQHGHLHGHLQEEDPPGDPEKLGAQSDKRRLFHFSTFPLFHFSIYSNMEICQPTPIFLRFLETTYNLFSCSI